VPGAGRGDSAGSSKSTGCSTNLLQCASRHAGLFIYGTWCFDARGEFEGEWSGLARAGRRRRLGGFHHGRLPRGFSAYPLHHGAPGGLPLLNFPEISMWGRYPWGGYGANPLPGRLQRLWRQVSAVCQGGFPYSEGIFEDINKAVCASFYRDRNAEALATVREYAACEFSPVHAGRIASAVELLERTYPRQTQSPDDVQSAWREISSIDRELPELAAKSWRWRILYLRALIDRELLNTPSGPHSDRCDEAFEELTEIYHAHNAGGPDAPPSRKCLGVIARPISR